MSAKILFLDIETAPCLGWTWGMYEQNVIDLQTSWYMLCFAAKWADEKTVKTYSLPDYSTFKKDREDDSALIKKLHELLDQADIVVAHNGDRFDLKKTNARFIYHGLKPPSPYKTIDTLKIARRHFAFVSNRLNDLGKYLGVGKKLPHTGFHLWKGCMQGDKKSWSMMKRYNAQDVTLLERVYLRLRPWASSHPDLSAYSHHEGCPTCESKRIQRRGVNVARKSIKPRFQCVDCGTWFSGQAIKKQCAA